MFGSSCSHVEQQYQRFIDDLTAALLVEKQMVLNCLDETWQRVCRQIDSHSRDSERCSRQLSELSSSCQAVSEESTTVGVLRRASELPPLVVHLKRHRREYDPRRNVSWYFACCCMILTVQLYWHVYRMSNSQGSQGGHPPGKLEIVGNLKVMPETKVCSCLRYVTVFNVMDIMWSETMISLKTANINGHWQKVYICYLNCL